MGKLYITRMSIAQIERASRGLSALAAVQRGEEITPSAKRDLAFARAVHYPTPPKAQAPAAGAADQREQRADVQ